MRRLHGRCAGPRGGRTARTRSSSATAAMCCASTPPRRTVLLRASTCWQPGARTTCAASPGRRTARARRSSVTAARCLLYDPPQPDTAAGSFAELPRVTGENLRRVAWSPDGSCALLTGNGGCVLRYDAVTGAHAATPRRSRAHHALDRLAPRRRLRADRRLREPARRLPAPVRAVSMRRPLRAGHPRDGRRGRRERHRLAARQRSAARADPRRALRRGRRAAPWQDRDVRRSGLQLPLDPAPRARRRCRSLSGRRRHAARPRLAPVRRVRAALRRARQAALAYDGQRMRLVSTGTSDNLVGPFWQPRAASPIALLLQGPDEKTYTV